MRYLLIDILRKTQVLKGYKEFLCRSYTHESLKSLQDNKLCEMLMFLRRSNPYYQYKLQKVPTSQIRSNPRKIIKTLPITDKLFMIRNEKLILQPVPGRKFQAKKTGGSTGDPLHYYIDLAAVSQSWAYILWSWHKYASYSPGDPFLTVAGNSLGPLANRFKTSLYYILQNNYLIAGDSISPQIRVASHRIRKSRLLYGYPSSIAALLEAIPGSFSGHRLKAVFTTSEQLLPNVRRFIEEQLRIPVYDMYGANDGGAISCECNEHNGFHYNPLNCYIEEHKNEDGLVELLLTSLNSYNFPFVRYRVGDVAVLDDFGSCSCGSPFPMIRHLKGRTRDMIKLKNGRKVHGSKINKYILHYPEILRYRVIQSSDFKITVQVEVNDFNNWAKSSHKSCFEEDMGNILPGAHIKIDSLVKMPSGNDKFKIIVSHVH
jgi:phenylacetate-CoA ligase